ncbi:hypothetical protein BFP71_14360 [Roseivirga misakiensis]|uniref:Peptidase S8/S53 domain-containing protein n=2 Tax=Roseivirga misakiensis TaxID=1563681 RepID=A0A1E5SZU8_9BACT|nr:hypothetical protein BFP71_14360 [Roseivirga misakiensis]
MVFFTDKANTNYSTNRPLEFLSQRAIDRRLKHNAAITSQDFPVNSSYVDQVGALGIETYYTSRWMNALLVQMEAVDVNNVMSLPFVESVEFVSPAAILSPPGEIEQTDDSPLPPPRVETLQYQMLGIDQMHTEGYMGSDVFVAIFDSGFNNYDNNPAFAHILAENRFIHTFNYVDNSIDVGNRFDHGLNVLSVLGADGEMIGAVPKASFMLAVTENEVSEYRIEEYNWLFAAEAADSIGVDIINTSLGYSEFDDASMDYTVSQMDGQTAVITRAANIAASKGILLVNSSGNQRNSPWGTITAPADSENVLAVGAINSIGVLAGFSSSGLGGGGTTKPDVVALGVNVEVTNPQGFLTVANGTSFSSPLVAGLATGLIEAFPEKTNIQLMDILRESGDRAKNPDDDYGFGIPLFERAVKIADESLIPIEEGIIAYPNPTDLPYFTLSFGEPFIGEEVGIEIYNSEGAKVEVYRIVPSLFNNKQEIDLSSIRPGLLVLRLTSSLGVITKKIIKRG